MELDGQPAQTIGEFQDTYILPWRWNFGMDLSCGARKRGHGLGWDTQ